MSKIWSLLIGIIGAFGYGILVGKYEVFPHDQLAGLKQSFGGAIEDQLVEQQFPKNISSAHVQFERTVYNYLNTNHLSGWGGAISAYKEGLLGVDKEGHFFFYKKGGDVTLLPNITIRNNEGVVQKLLSKENLGSLTFNRIMNTFRILDLLVHQGEKCSGLMISDTI